MVDIYKYICCIYLIIIPFFSVYHCVKSTHHGLENSIEAVNAKKTRMRIVKTLGLVKAGSSGSNKIEWYYKKKLENTPNYRTFLNSSNGNLLQLHTFLLADHPIKYNTKLEATYIQPYLKNSAENHQLGKFSY